MSNREWLRFELRFWPLAYLPLLVVLLEFAAFIVMVVALGEAHIRSEVDTTWLQVWAAALATFFVLDVAHEPILAWGKRRSDALFAEVEDRLA